MQGQNYSWYGGNGFWDDAINWAPSSDQVTNWPTGWYVDISHDDAQDRRIVFRQGGLEQPHSEVYLTHLKIGNAGSGETTLVLSDHDNFFPEIAEALEIPKHELSLPNFWLGHDGEATLEMTGGILNVTNQFIIGEANTNSGFATHEGRFELSGGDVYFEVPGQGGLRLFDVGGKTSGTVIQTGGHVHAQGNATNQIRLGTSYLQYNRETHIGRYELAGGQIDAWHLKIGQGFRGEFIQSGGVNNVFDLQVGDRHQNGERVASGYYELSGGDLETIAYSATVNTNGSFLQTGGTHLTRSLYVYGDYQLLDGSVSLQGYSGETITVGGTFTQSGGSIDLANGDDGAMRIQDGGVYTLGGGSLEGGGLEIGGSFLQSGGTLDLGNRAIHVTESGGWSWLGGTITGSAREVVIDGLAVVSGPNAFFLDIDVGKNAGTLGYYTISGSSDLLSGTIDLGGSGKGTLDVQTSGTISVLNLNVGQITGGEGTVVLRSGTVDSAALKIGENGTGEVDVRDGLLKATVRMDLFSGGSLRQSGGQITTPIAAMQGEATLSGGELIVTNRMELSSGGTLATTGDFIITTEGPGLSSAGKVSTPELNLHGGTITAATFQAQGGVLNATGDNRINARSNFGDTEMTINGTLRLAGETTFSGGYFMGEGTLVNEGTMITGYNSFDHAFTNEGILLLNTDEVTDSASVSFTETFTQTAMGRMVLSVMNPFSMSSYDTINFSQEANLAGTFELVLEDGVMPVAGVEMTILNFAADYSPVTGLTPLVNGWFDEVILPELAEGFTWDTSQLQTFGTLSMLAPISAVPEPETATVMAGLIVWGFMLSRRRRAGARSLHH